VVPGKFFVKIGSLDERAGLTLGAQIWTKSRPEWLQLDPDAPAFERNPGG
jgi:hypothetical protein